VALGQGSGTQGHHASFEPHGENYIHVLEKLGARLNRKNTTLADRELHGSG